MELVEPSDNPRIQELWYNFLPGRFLELRQCSKKSEIHSMKLVFETICRVIPLCGLDPRDAESILQDAKNVIAEGYARYIGDEISSMTKYINVQDGLEMYRDFKKLRDLCLPPILEIDPYYIIKMESKYYGQVQNVPFTQIYAYQLQEFLNREIEDYYSRFEDLVNRLLEKAEEYATNIDFPNIFFDLRLRFRELEIYLDDAEKYAEEVGMDITEKRNEIVIKARKVLNIDNSALN